MKLFSEVALKVFPELNVNEIRFEIDQTRLQLIDLSKSDFPIGHWVISEHYDYDRSKVRIGEEKIKGELSTKLNQRWQDRALVRVNPIDFRSKEVDQDNRRFSTNEITGRSYIFGQERIPGLNETIIARLESGSQLPPGIQVRSGDIVKVELTRTHMIVYNIVCTERSSIGFGNATPRWGIAEDCSPFRSRDFIDSMHCSADENRGHCIELARMPLVYYDLVVKRDPATGFWKDRMEVDVEKPWQERAFVTVNSDGIEYIKKIEPLEQELVLSKSVVDTESEFLYLPSVIESPMNISASIPHFQGIEKVVKFRFTETALQIYEVNVYENRFQDNPTNGSPVISIPVRHIEYRCSLDESGRCTDRKVEDTEIDWRQRTMFKPDLANMKVHEVNILPIIFDSYLVPHCFGERESKLLGFETTADAWNIKVERSFRGNLLCPDLGDIETLSDLGFNVGYHYSIVKLKNLESPNYKAIDYPRDDEDYFGFFKTEYVQMDHANDPLQKNEVIRLNRWNPEREKVVYHLNDNFYKPENKAIYDATIEAIKTINVGLAKAKVKFKLVLADEEGENRLPDGSRFIPDPGDLRYNMIMLVDDPGKYGLLGYGPSAKHPITGEILNARTVMYGGIFRRVVKRAYDDVYETSLKTRVETTLPKLVTQYRNDVVPKTGSELFSNPASRFEELNRTNFPGIPAISARPGVTEVSLSFLQSAMTEAKLKDSAKIFVNAQAIEDLENLQEPALMLEEKSLRQVFEELRDKNKAVQVDEIAFMSEHNACFHDQMIDFHDDLKRKILEIVGGANNMRPWEDLGEEEQKKIVDKVLPAVWTGTFIHEIGHNLGLRHNFKGSEDKDNYFTAEETKSGFVVPYSSVMDYGAKDIEELNQFGKYDIAALRFGYAREVELKNRQFVKIPSTISKLSNKDLKEYQYCSDEGVALNPLCNRFDLGVGYTGVAEETFKLYRESYKRANQRRGRTSYSLLDDGGYMLRVNSTFRNLRLYYETYERIFKMFNIPYGTTFGPGHWVTDLDGGVKSVFEGYLKVLTTPDRVCIFARTNN